MKTFKLESFEGPLDLLLHLIDKAEVDIYNIPIKEITAQYLEYLNGMSEMELDITSEFLVMAATLLSIKSKMLLPKPPPMNDLDDNFEDEEYDPRAELVQKLIEYRKYKGIAEHLRDKEFQRSLLYSREPGDLSPYLVVVEENPLEGILITDIMFAFQKVMRKLASRHVITKIKRDEISVKDRMKEIINILQMRGNRFLFSNLFDDEVTREEVVVSFLAVLELMKMKRIVCFQDHLFDDIVIQAREEGKTDGFTTDEVDY
mgnify:CR=1 FL=1